MVSRYKLALFWIALRALWPGRINGEIAEKAPGWILMTCRRVRQRWHHSLPEKNRMRPPSASSVCPRLLSLRAPAEDSSAATGGGQTRHCTPCGLFGSGRGAQGDLPCSGSASLHLRSLTYYSRTLYNDSDVAVRFERIPNRMYVASVRGCANRKIREKCIR
jgi:hypothetical protein